MRTVLATGLMVVAVATSIAAHATEVQIPRTMADKGKYYLLDTKTNSGITATLHKRVGVSETGYSKTEINCKTMQYRDMGYSEVGPDRLAGGPGKWTDILSGSSKSDLVNFVCSRKP
ncbi:hypothetical protein [Duganella phyllosphaerae]|uniref:Uncharacterized protein n=1 Tax=Duganella phyllosphaerae TaxID=762836 RepID=A0A1E7X7D8_9BURK|nr:hypothetical protein [Duganella phyllosphaerae]OFA09047.1 hypothetical protein DUPY_02890 [Duganella phyllosphaerae]